MQILALAALVAAAAAAAQPAEPAAARTTEPEADPAARSAPGDLAPTRPVAPARAAAGSLPLVEASSQHRRGDDDLLHLLQNRVQCQIAQRIHDLKRLNVADASRLFPGPNDRVMIS